jgi:hypothetical protein
MSFWKALFGRHPSGESGQQRLGETVEYKGYVIRSAPIAEAGKFLTAGVIEKEVAGERKIHRFIRADTHPTFDAAAAFSLDKARQIIDLQGERLFDSRNG